MKKHLLWILLILSLLLGAVIPIPLSHIPLRNSRQEESGVFSSLNMDRPPADIRVKLYWMSMVGTQLHDVQHAQPFRYTEESIQEHSLRFLNTLVSHTVSAESLSPRKCLLLIDSYGYFLVWEVSVTFSMGDMILSGTCLFDDETGGVLNIDLHASGGAAYTWNLSDDGLVYYHMDNRSPTPESVKQALEASWDLTDIELQPYQYYEGYYWVIIPRGEYRSIKLSLSMSPGHIKLGH